MIEITPTLAIDEDEIEEIFTRASGPGGQNVNKVTTAVQLRFDVAHSASLPEFVRQRLTRLAGKRLTADGVLIIEARRFRSQEQNRQDALRRLMTLVHQAAQPPKPRRKTRPTPASQEKRLRQKQQRGQVKRFRQSPSKEIE